MSYVHCPSCGHAFNLASGPCSSCSPRELVAVASPNAERCGEWIDPAEAIVAAAEQLARAIASATTAQLFAAASAMERRWRVADPSQPSILGAIRGVLAPPAVKKRSLLATAVKICRDGVNSLADHRRRIRAGADRTFVPARSWAA